jgi:chaperonin cofactor prefoldin
MGKNKQLRRAENRKAQKEAYLNSLSEYSRKVETLQSQIGKLTVRINSLQRQQRTASLALTHLESTASANDKYYMQLGRLFVQEPLGSVVDSLKMDAESATGDLPKLLSALNQFEKLKKEVLEQIKELNESVKTSSEQ